MFLTILYTFFPTIIIVFEISNSSISTNLEVQTSVSAILVRSDCFANNSSRATIVVFIASPNCRNSLQPIFRVIWIPSQFKTSSAPKGPVHQLLVCVHSFILSVEKTHPPLQFLMSFNIWACSKKVRVSSFMYFMRCKQLHYLGVNKN